MTRISRLAMLTLVTVLPAVSPALARSTHDYSGQGLTVTPAMMAAINTIVAEHAKMVAHRRHH